MTIAPRRLMLALLVAAAPAAPLGAQTAAELTALRDSLEQRFEAARVRLEGAENQARDVPNDSLMLSGAVVRFRAENLSERERRALTRAFAAAAAELEAMFGAEGPSLMRGHPWQVTIREGRGFGDAAALGLDALEGERRVTSASLRLPLDIAEATKAIREHAGRELVSRHDAIRRWTNNSFRLDEPARTHYFAHRHLALHQSSPARRCARGTISACLDIFDNASRDRWFDPGDDVNTERVPASGIVRESLLRYAVEQDGQAIFRALRTPSADEGPAVAAIASALGETPEQLLTGWQAELATSGSVRVHPRPGQVLTAIGWFAFCGVMAARRRPA